MDNQSTVAAVHALGDREKREFEALSVLGRLSDHLEREAVNELRGCYKALLRAIDEDRIFAANDYAESEGEAFVQLAHLGRLLAELSSVCRYIADRGDN